MSSADSSFTSSADDSLHQVSSSNLPLNASITAADGTLLSTPVNSKNNRSSSGTAESVSLSYNKKHRRARVRRESNVSDNSAMSPSASFLHKRRRLKSRPSFDGDIIECDGRVKRNLSQRLPSDNSSPIELGEIHTKRRRRLKRNLPQLLPSDSDDGVETVVRKRRRLSASKTLSQTAQIKAAEDATMPLTPSRAQFGKAARGKVVASDVQVGCSSAGNTSLTKSAVITSSASRQAPLQLQNMLTGRRYVLQPVKVML